MRGAGAVQVGPGAGAQLQAGRGEIPATMAEQRLRGLPGRRPAACAWEHLSSPTGRSSGSRGQQLSRCNQSSPHPRANPAGLGPISPSISGSSPGGIKARRGEEQA